MYDAALDTAIHGSPNHHGHITLNLGGDLAVTGSGFRGISEGSSGSAQASPADYPVLFAIIQFGRRQDCVRAVHQLVGHELQLGDHLEFPARAGHWRRCSVNGIKAPAASST